MVKLVIENSGNYILGPSTKALSECLRELLNDSEFAVAEPADDLIDSRYLSDLLDRLDKLEEREGRSDLLPLIDVVEDLLDTSSVLSKSAFVSRIADAMQAAREKERERAEWRNHSPDTLISLMNSADWDTAREATKWLGQAMDDLASCASPQEELLGFLEYANERVRLMAAESLVWSAKTGNFESDPEELVMKLLDTHDSAVHDLVAEECSEILDEENVDILHPYFEDENIDFKWKLAESVEKIGGEKAAWTLKDYKARESRRRQEMIRGYIKDLDNPDTVAAAAANLGVFDDEAAIAIQPLLRVLRESENSEARAEAAASIGNIGVSDSDCVTALSHAATSDFQGAVREAAIRALAKREWDSPGVVATFVHALEHDTLDIRATAALALDSCKGNADRAVYALIGALQRESDYTVRNFAIASLGRLMTVKAAKTLTTYLRDANIDISLAAARALAAGRPQAEIVVPALIESLADVRFIEHRDMAWYEHVCDAAGESLIEIGRPAAEILKRAASEHPDPSIRDEASRLYDQVLGLTPGN